MYSLRILHNIKGRLRAKYSLLQDDSINPNSLIAHLQGYEGVHDVKVNTRNKTITLNYASNVYSQEAVEDILCHLDISALPELSISCSDCHDHEVDKKELLKNASSLAVVPLLPNDTLKTLATLGYTSPMILEGAKELFSKGVTSHVLESLAVAISAFRKDYLSANSTNFLLSVGEYMEESMSSRSDDLLRELMKPQIDKVWIEQDGVEEEVAFEALKVGDIVIVGVGSTIAVDGHIISGEALVNQASMTGEAVPVKKARGDRVMSGTIVEEGRIKIWAESVGDETATAKITEFIQNSLNEKSSTQQRANELAEKLVPVTLGLAGFAYLSTRRLDRVAAVLQADYSCALKLATPVAFKSSMHKAGKQGITLKGAKSLEALSEVDTFVFDKTGTLTEGDLEVAEVISFDKEWNADSILSLAASAEEHYFHPVAEAVVKAARAKDFVHVHHSEVEFIVAHGVATTVAENKKVVIGSRHFLEDDEGISFEGHHEVIKLHQNQGRTLLYVGYDNKLLGLISMNDRVRHDAKTTLKRLRKAGVKKVVMLTGDNQIKADEIASLLGIDEVYAELQPTDKAEIVKELKNKGARIAFVGDGINDAPALVSADVGFSMAKAADIANASADVVLLKDSISAVADAKELADKTIRLVKNNFNITVGANSAILIAATLGKLSPVKTAILHNGTTVALLLNAIKGVSLKK